MNILLTGASGFVGQHISNALQGADHKVKAVTRSNGFDYNQMTSAKDWLPLLNDIDVVINCVGIIAETGEQSFETLHHKTPVALFRSCMQIKNIRVIQISALGADEWAFAPYQLTKKAADDVLRSLPLKWFVLRPSLIYGKGGKSMEMFKRMASLPVLPLMNGGNQQVQPVYIKDLTDTVIKCLTSSKVNLTLDIVGAHSVSFKEWLQLMRTTKGQNPAVIISVPFKFCLATAQILKHIIPTIHPDNLQMLQKGNFSDVKPLCEFLGHSPLDIKTGWNKL